MGAWLSAFWRFLCFMLAPVRGVGSALRLANVFIWAIGVGSPIAIGAGIVPVPEDVPRWLFIAIILLAAFFFLSLLAGIRIQHSIDSQYGRGAHALDALARFREEGVKLWNRAPKLTTEEVQGWIVDIEAWQSRVTVEIAALSNVEARLFQTLRYWTAPNLAAPVTFDHSLHYRMLHRRLEIIEELIRRFSPL